MVVNVSEIYYNHGHATTMCRKLIRIIWKGGWSWSWRKMRWLTTQQCGLLVGSWPYYFRSRPWWRWWRNIPYLRHLCLKRRDVNSSPARSFFSVSLPSPYGTPRAWLSQRMLSSVRGGMGWGASWWLAWGVHQTRNCVRWWVSLCVSGYSRDGKKNTRQKGGGSNKM